MSGDDKSMVVQLIYNQGVVTYNKFQCMNLMGLSDPWDDSIEIIDLYPVKMQGMNPMGLSTPWENSLDKIYFRPVRKIASNEPNWT